MIDPGLSAHANFFSGTHSMAAKLTHLNRHVVSKDFACRLANQKKQTTGARGPSYSWVASCIWSADCSVALAYVRSNPVVEVKLLSVPKKVLSACFPKTFSFRPP
jgi:hypothetical protein